MLLEASKMNAQQVLRILGTYAPRVSCRLAPSSWWRRLLSDVVHIEVQGPEPYVQRALAEVQEWEIEEQMRRAW